MQVGAPAVLVKDGERQRGLVQRREFIGLLGGAEFARSGALFRQRAELADLFRRAAGHIDRISRANDGRVPLLDFSERRSLSLRRSAP